MTKMASVLAFGSRDYCNGLYVSQRLQQVHDNLIIMEIIEGEAKGADILARDWARRNEIPVVKCPANWETEGKGAGFLRNLRMVEMNPDMAVGFMNGPSKGSMHTVQLCLAKGIPLYIVDMDNRLLKLPKSKKEVIDFLS